MEKKNNSTAKKNGVFSTLGNWFRRTFRGGSKEMSDDEKFAIEKIESDELYLAEHVLKACLDVADYYGYDYSMGTLENPTAIDGVEDLIDYVED